MIIFDTNVVSELMRATPDEHVIRWADTLAAADVYLTAVTVGELLYGVARLPAGRRRQDIARRLEAMLAEDFDHRVVPFDEQAAGHYADIVAHRDRLGRPIGIADAQIASIARTYAATLATRNVADFSDTGINVVNPWRP